MTGTEKVLRVVQDALRTYDKDNVVVTVNEESEMMDVNIRPSVISKPSGTFFPAIANAKDCDFIVLKASLDLLGVGYTNFPEKDEECEAFIHTYKCTRKSCDGCENRNRRSRIIADMILESDGMTIPLEKTIDILKRYDISSIEHFD